MLKPVTPDPAEGVTPPSPTDASLGARLDLLYRGAPLSAVVGLIEAAVLSTLFWRHVPLPALLGWLMHAPLYFPIRILVAITSRYNDHFDSIVAGLLLLLYPFYWMMLLCLGCSYYGLLGCALAAGAPLMVRALLYWLPQTD